MKTRIPLEPARAVYLAALTVLLVFFFQLWRVILYLIVETPGSPVPTGTLLRAFAIGTRFDLAVSSYIVLPLTVLAFLPVVGLNGMRLGRGLHVAVLTVLVGLAFFVQLADIEFYRFFNYRINGMALQWDETPGMVLSLLWQTYPVIRYLLLFGVILSAFLLGAHVLYRRLLPASPVTPRLLPAIAWGSVTLALLFLGMRGTLEEKAPLSWGTAYFSEYTFANQLALNPNFTFARDAIYDADGARRVRRIMEGIGTPGSNGRLFAAGEHANTGNDTTSAPGPPQSVILIIMESFGASHIGALDNQTGHHLSPAFDSLAQDGVLFTRCYSNGMHTYTGIISTLFGIPTLPGKSIMKRVVRDDHLHGLPSILRDHGYRTLFFTTHDPHFDNMQGFLLAHDIERIVSVFDYDPDLKMSTLGVADHVMFERAEKELAQVSPRPFFAALLTSSNHGPWVVPDVPFGPLPDSVADAARLNAFRYSDWALGRFIRSIRSNPGLANTLIVVTADNGLPVDPKTDLDPSQFHIPLLLLAPNRPEIAGTRNDQLAGQIDILPTVLGLIGLEDERPDFGRNLLAADSTDDRAFAIFSEDFRVGFIEDGYLLVWRYEAPRSLFRMVDGRLGDSDDSPAIADRLETRALSVFRTAYMSVMDPPIAHDDSGDGHPGL
ncbi:MAG: sulfatase-like hydrolase/transferase [Candidatus Zixiibacteriota bacterium]